MPARDVQYNPRKPHALVSCGDGCKIKFWDARSMVEPLLEFGGHTHWVWQARYNPFHDQLVLVRAAECSRLARCACVDIVLAFRARRVPAAIQMSRCGLRRRRRRRRGRSTTRRRRGSLRRRTRTARSACTTSTRRVATPSPGRCATRGCLRRRRTTDASQSTACRATSSTASSCDELSLRAIHASWLHRLRRPAPARQEQATRTAHDFCAGTEDSKRRAPRSCVSLASRRSVRDAAAGRCVASEG